MRHLVWVGWHQRASSTFSGTRPAGLSFCVCVLLFVPLHQAIALSHGWRESCGVRCKNLAMGWRAEQCWLELLSGSVRASVRLVTSLDTSRMGESESGWGARAGSIEYGGGSEDNSAVVVGASHRYAPPPGGSATLVWPSLLPCWLLLVAELVSGSYRATDPSPFAYMPSLW